LPFFRFDSLLPQKEETFVTAMDIYITLRCRNEKRDRTKLVENPQGN
jgi:hypothetical protein